MPDTFVDDAEQREAALYDAIAHAYVMDRPCSVCKAKPGADCTSPKRGWKAGWQHARRIDSGLVRWRRAR